MEANQNKTDFGDQEMFSDALYLQKYTTDTYNQFINTATTQSIYSDALNLLCEEHQIQLDIFNEMNKRGWCNDISANKEKAKQVKTKYQSK